MNSEENTLSNNEQVLKAIMDLRSEFTGSRSEIADLRREMNAKFEDMRLRMMSFDVLLDRMQALVYEALTVGHNTGADVRVLPEEVTGWAKEIKNL